jgi:hypothetical protein
MYLIVTYSTKITKNTTPKYGTYLGLTLKASPT